MLVWSAACAIVSFAVEDNVLYPLVEIAPLRVFTVRVNFPVLINVLITRSNGSRTGYAALFAFRVLFLWASTHHGFGVLSQCFEVRVLRIVMHITLGDDHDGDLPTP